MSQLILTEKTDGSAALVADWIRYLGGNPILLDSLFFDRNITIELFSNGIPGVNVYGSSFNSVWFRRPPKIDNSDMIDTDKVVEQFVIEESLEFRIFLSSALNYSCKVLGTNSQYYTPYSTSKLHCLLVAAENGLKIPNTIISTSTESLKKFISKFSKCIVKPLSNPIHIFIENGSLFMLTEVIDLNIINLYENKIFPAFVQEYIRKEFEIRTFYLDGQFYSSAIFSQSDVSTEIDFRNYNEDKPNRVVPFNLDKKIKKNLKNVFKKMGLNTGSADLIYTPDGDYFFLEINPVGQFGMVSMPCNYHIEKKIATFLIQ